MRYAILVFAVGLAGCVQARINAYYHPKPPEPCEVRLVIDGKYSCISREHARQILRDMTP